MLQDLVHSDCCVLFAGEAGDFGEAFQPEVKRPLNLQHLDVAADASGEYADAGVLTCLQ